MHVAHDSGGTNFSLTRSSLEITASLQLNENSAGLNFLVKSSD